MLKRRTSIIVLCIAAAVAVLPLPGVSIAVAALLIWTGIALPALRAGRIARPHQFVVVSASRFATTSLRAPPTLLA